jgi:hypothetical protein
MDLYAELGQGMGLPPGLTITLLLILAAILLVKGIDMIVEYVTRLAEGEFEGDILEVDLDSYPWGMSD